MPFYRLYYHLVWAVKNRENLLQPEIEKRLYAYLVNKGREIGIYTYAVNGCYDHIHLVVSIPPKLSVATVVKRLKGASSHNLNHRLGGFDGSFAWQRGYGALSVGERQRSIAEAYVRKQKEHHQAQTTNAWLERYTEFDEGPDDADLAKNITPSIVHEDTEIYRVLDAPWLF